MFFEKKAWLLFSMSGLFTLMGQLSVFLALEIGTVVVVSPLSSVTPFFVVLLAAVFLRKLERVTWRTVTGAVLIIAGTMTLILFR